MHKKHTKDQCHQKLVLRSKIDRMLAGLREREKERERERGFKQTIRKDNKDFTTDCREIKKKKY